MSLYESSNSRHSRWLTGLLTLALALTAVPVGAQVEEAQQLAEQAGEAFQQFDFAEAAELYARAFELDPHPVILYNQARCFEELHDLPRALAVLWRALELAPTGRVFEAIETKAAEVETRLMNEGHELENVDRSAFTTLARLSVTSLPSGADVFIGDDYVGATPVDDLFIAPGQYDVTVSMTDYRPSYRSVEVEPIRHVTIHAGLRRIGDIVFNPAEPGLLELIGPRNGMLVYLDDDYYGRTPVSAMPVPPGSYTVRVTHDLYEDWTTEIEIVSSETTALYAHATRKESLTGDEGFGRSDWGILLLATGGAALTTGVIFGVISRADEDRYHRNLLSPNRDEIRDSAVREAFVADIAFISAGVLVATGVILVLTDHGDEDDEIIEPPDGLLEIGLGPTRDGWGVVWTGEF